MLKIAGKYLLKITNKNHLTNCAGCDIMENPAYARISRPTKQKREI